MRFEMSSGGSALTPRAQILDHELLRVRAPESGPKRRFVATQQSVAFGGKADIDSRPRSSRLAEFGGRGISFKICRGTLVSSARLRQISAEATSSPKLSQHKLVAVGRCKTILRQNKLCFPNWVQRRP
jgi:hypothetical protein